MMDAKERRTKDEGDKDIMMHSLLVDLILFLAANKNLRACWL
jgi:hypothetical protein